MAENIQPIKRSPQLAPLSREHHDALLFAWKLKQGLANGTSLQVLQKYCHWYWKNHTKKHFHDEEEVLLRYVPSDHVLVKQLKEEHNNIRELILSIDRKPDTITIGMLADFVSRHIRFEERAFFKYLEENLSASQLDEIHSELEKGTASCSGWDDVFWSKTK